MCTSARDLELKNALQIAEVNSDFNRWVAGVHIGRPPTFEDAFWHWFLNGGREAFNERWNRGEFRTV